MGTSGFDVGGSMFLAFFAPSQSQSKPVKASQTINVALTGLTHANLLAHLASWILHRASSPMLHLPKIKPNQTQSNHFFDQRFALTRLSPLPPQKIGNHRSYRHQGQPAIPMLVSFPLSWKPIPQ
jgi:hypothetical protein